MAPAQQRDEEVVEVDVALTRGADHTRQDLLCPRAVGSAIPATDLAVDDGGADGVFGPPVGRVLNRSALTLDPVFEWYR